MSEKKHTTMEAIHGAILRAVTDHWKDQPNQLDTVAEYDPFERKPVNSPLKTWHWKAETALAEPALSWTAT